MCSTETLDYRYLIKNTSIERRDGRLAILLVGDQIEPVCDVPSYQTVRQQHLIATAILISCHNFAYCCLNRTRFV